MIIGEKDLVSPGAGVTDDPERCGGAGFRKEEGCLTRGAGWEQPGLQSCLSSATLCLVSKSPAGFITKDYVWCSVRRLPESVSDLQQAWESPPGPRSNAGSHG